MELKDFIRDTLVNITQGVQEAQEAVQNSGAIINPKAAVNRMLNPNEIIQNLEFEIGLTYEKEKSNKTGIGVMFSAVGLGSQFSGGNKDGSVTKIRFSVPLILPFHQEKLS